MDFEHQRIREHIALGDRSKVFDLLCSNGFFHPREMAYGMDLLDEHIMKGERSPYTFMLCEQDNKLLAFGCYGRLRLTNHRFHLHWLAVEKEYQNKGLGFNLEKAIVEKIRALGGVKIYAETSNREQHTNGRSFYEKCGYKPVVKIPDYYDAGDDMVLYMKDLSFCPVS